MKTFIYLSMKENLPCRVRAIGEAFQKLAFNEVRKELSIQLFLRRGLRPDHTNLIRRPPDPSFFPGAVQWIAVPSLDLR